MGRGRDLGGTLEVVACNTRVIVSVPGPHSTCPKRQINPTTKTYPSLSCCAQTWHICLSHYPWRDMLLGYITWHLHMEDIVTAAFGLTSYAWCFFHPPPPTHTHTSYLLIWPHSKHFLHRKMLLRVVHDTALEDGTRGGEIRPWNCFGIMKWIALFFFLWKVCISLSCGKKKKDPEQNQCVTISMWCSAQCSGGGCPDETWLLAVLSPVKQHHQWPITRSCTRPWRSKPQGLSVSVKPLFTLTYINVTDVQKCRNVAFFFFTQQYVVFSCLRHSWLIIFSSSYFSSVPLETNLLHHLLWYTACWKEK